MYNFKCTEREVQGLIKIAFGLDVFRTCKYNSAMSSSLFHSTFFLSNKCVWGKYGVRYFLGPEPDLHSSPTFIVVSRIIQSIYC